jgi:hypothetical protein
MLNPKARLASRYSGLISRDAVLRATGRMLALELDRERAGDEGNEREGCRGGLGRKSSKLLLRIVTAERSLALCGAEERRGTHGVNASFTRCCTFFGCFDAPTAPSKPGPY